MSVVKKVETESKDITYSRAKFLRISPSKVRRIANQIRGMNANQALAVLSALPHSGSEILKKVLKSAMHNASHNLKLEQDGLYISTLMIDEGPRMKRFQPKARGRIYQILKRSCHIYLGLKNIEGVS